jgi:hypothetical protein
MQSRSNLLFLLGIETRKYALNLPYRTLDARRSSSSENKCPNSEILFFGFGEPETPGKLLDLSWLPPSEPLFLLCRLPLAHVFIQEASEYRQNPQRNMG